MEHNAIVDTPLNHVVVGLDCHPDSFTAAILEGPTPASAVTKKVFNKVPIGRLVDWATKNTTANDLIVLEASGNSFEMTRRVRAIPRRVEVLESSHLGKLKEAHANNDKLSAVRIAKAYLAGTAKIVWVPDAKTQERRDIFHMHRKVVKRCTQIINRLNSYLSDHGVRLKESLTELDEQSAWQKIRAVRTWEPSQERLIAGLMLEVQAASQQRQHWQRVIATEVLADPLLLSLTRLCGVRDIVAFACGALIGDINRFARPKSLVNYLGLNPRFDDSGNDSWSGGVGGRGRRDLRALLTESAQSVLRSSAALGDWGRRLLASKKCYNLAVAAVARKLAVAIWYLMKGKWDKIQTIDRSLSIKIGKMLSKIGNEGFKELGQSRRAARKQVLQLFKTGRTDYIEPSQQVKAQQAKAKRPKGHSTRRPRSTTLAEEYGLK
jgi:transposase